MNWLVYDYYLYAVAALLGTFAAAGLLVWILGRPRWAGTMGSMAGVVPPFINVLGVLFGLTLAFLANDTWSAQDRALAAVNREADSLRALTILASHLPANDSARVRGAVDDYVRAALSEWPLLSRRETSADASAKADSLLAVLCEPRLQSESSTATGEHEIALAIAVRDSRETRLALSQTHVNPLKWVGMAMLGFLTMVSVAIVHIGTPRAMRLSVALFALASAPTAVIVLVHGNPFQQPAAVSSRPLAAVLIARP